MDVLSEIVLVLGSGLVSASVVLTAQYFALRRFESRAIESINPIIVQKLTEFLKILHEKPEMFKPVVNGLLSDLQKVVEIPDFKAGGMTVSADGIDALMPMIPRRWRGPVSIMRMFMGQQTKEEKKPNSSPFG